MLKLKTLRTEKRWSQRTLASLIHSSQKSVDCWEKGLSEPSAKFIVAMADCFGCSADYLLGREDEFGNVNVESDLTIDEKTLLDYYRGIKKDKRKELINYAKYLFTQYQ